MNEDVLTPQQLEELREKLSARRVELKKLLAEELKKADSEQYNELAGQVHDAEEASVADMLVDLNLATIEHHVEEMRQVEDALLRMKNGEYGRCIQCGGPIGVTRLQANPMALRCIQCQEAWERTHAGTQTPAL